MAKPFPFPKTFVCPYCGMDAIRGDMDSHNRVHYHHEIEANKKVGEAICVTLHTCHQFVIVWNDELAEWVVFHGDFGSSKKIEQVELGNGCTTGWCPFDD